MSSDVTVAPANDLPLHLAEGMIFMRRYVLESELRPYVWTARVDAREVELHFIPQALWLEPGLRADLLRQVNRHQALRHAAVQRIYEIAEEGECGAVVMERLPGVSLGVLMERGGVLAPEEVRKWVRTICSVIEEAHEEGLVYRELEPGKVFISGEGEVRLGNFGVTELLSAFVADKEGDENAAFASPQQVAGEAATVADDLFSIGALMEWMLAAGPFPDGWGEAVAACLKKEAEERPASVRELRGQLGLAREEKPFEEERAVVSPAVAIPVMEPEVREIAPVEATENTPESVAEEATPEEEKGAVLNESKVIEMPVAEGRRRSVAVPVLTVLLLAAGGAAGWWFGVELPKREAHYREQLEAQSLKATEAQEEAQQMRAELEKIAKEKAAAEVAAKVAVSEAHEAKSKAEEAAVAAFRAAAEEKASRADRLAREGLELLAQERSSDRDAQVFLLFREASELGHPEATARLGGFYLDGRGIERDPEEARKLLEKAAKRSGYAQWRLGGIYEEGIGVEKDRDKAITYFRAAADQGQPGALHRLAESQLDSDDPVKAAEAMQWMTEAALGGYPEAQSRLGVIYGTGAGVADQDEAEALRWLERAEAQKWPVADDYVMVAAWLHLDGGMNDAALRWYRKAAERGNASAQMELANHYLTPPLTAVSLQEARQWLELAAAQGDEKAIALLKTVPVVAAEPAAPNSEAPSVEPPNEVVTEPAGAAAE